jgi:hypothetical protein
MKIVRKVAMVLVVLSLLLTFLLAGPVLAVTSYTDTVTIDSGANWSPAFPWGCAIITGDTAWWTPANPIIQQVTAVSVTVTAYDVDSPSEVDEVYLNGVYLGDLVGASDTTTDTTFNLTAGQIVAIYGAYTYPLNQDVEVHVDTATCGFWRVIVDLVTIDITYDANQPPIADAGPDQILEQTSHAGAEVILDGSASSDPDSDPLTYEWGWDGELAFGVSPTVVLPLGTTTVTLLVSDGIYTDSDTVDITVVDTTPPEVFCFESVNPHGNKTPPAGSTTLPGPKGGQNEDGFYMLRAVDICDANPQIFVGDASGIAFGPFSSGDVVKITEDPTVPSVSKPMGSSKGKAGAVAAHIILASDPVVFAVDASGNLSLITSCLVPAPPK